MLINPSKLTGEISAIPSKSYAHRALICAGLAQGKSQIYFDKSSKDIEATISCLKNLGAGISKIDGGLEVEGIKKIEGLIPQIDANESGSSLRFILPLASVFYDECKFTGKGRLPDRPIKDLLDLMKEHGVTFSKDKLPFTTTGNLNSGIYKIKGDVSSQYITGLLFASVLMDKPCKIILTSKLQSKSYVDISLDVMEKFGIKIKEKSYGYEIFPQEYKKTSYEVEGDWSNGSFFLVAAALGGDITLKNINTHSKQGDMKILDILKDYGAELNIGKDFVRVRAKERRPIQVDLKDIPDMLPILSVLAAGANGTSRFYNGKRLRMKESDRLRTSAKMIENLGGKICEKEDELLVYGSASLKGGKISSYNDHRIAMAGTIASVISTNKIELTGEGAVDKSYPEFFKDFKSLGGTLAFDENTRG